MKIKDEWREKLFHQAQSLGLSGAVFQNPMDIDLKDLVFELTEIEDRRTKMNMDLNQYGASIRALIREGLTK